MRSDRMFVDVYSHTNKDDINKRKSKSRWILKSIVCFFAVFSFSCAVIGSYVLGVLIERSRADEKYTQADGTYSIGKKTDGDSVPFLDSALSGVVGICVYDSECCVYASGVIISSDGYIVTNDHVFSDVVSPKIKVYDKDGNYNNAAYIGGDSKYDIAVIKTEQLGLNTIETAPEVSVGETVYSIGCPIDDSLSMSVTKGIISGTDRRIGTLSNQYSPKLIQTDAAINPGCSGGALTDSDGRLIGINCSKLVQDDCEGIGFAVPAEKVMEIADKLISDGCIYGRARLGISYTCLNYTRALMSDTRCGIVIRSIEITSDLYGKGFGDGDVITSVNGQRILCEDDFLTVIENSSAGDRVHLDISMSDGSSRETDVVLIEEKPAFSYKN